MERDEIDRALGSDTVVELPENLKNAGGPFGWLAQGQFALRQMKKGRGGEKSGEKSGE